MPELSEPLTIRFAFRGTVPGSLNWATQTYPVESFDGIMKHLADVGAIRSSSLCRHGTRTSQSASYPSVDETWSIWSRKEDQWSILASGADDLSQLSISLSDAVQTGQFDEIRICPPRFPRPTP